MRIRISPELHKELRRIKRKDPKLARHIKRQLTTFAVNPRHPSLRLHRLTGKLKKMWSISITQSMRMVYVLLSDDEAYFTDLGTHDEVYRQQ